MTISIEYGVDHQRKNVTTICLEKLCTSGVIAIPPYDHIRIGYFTDAAPGHDKSIYVTIDNETTHQYGVSQTVVIYLDSGDVKAIAHEDVEIHEKYKGITHGLKIIHGDFTSEVPEMKMAIRYLTGTEKVLELGANVGRNTLVISHIMGDNAHNLVTLECDPDNALKLAQNWDVNGMKFQIESSALSSRRLIQHGWDTAVLSEDGAVPVGWKEVETIEWSTLVEKYKVSFDTLVADCEGALYPILKDMPEMLDNIELVIMENDYHKKEEKEYVDNVLRAKGFRVDYVEFGGFAPCYHNFFEVWKKRRHT